MSKIKQNNVEVSIYGISNKRNVKGLYTSNDTNSTKAFTLVELIVTITILAILWTIAFILFQGYLRDARDSVRLSDFKNIQKAFSLILTK